MQKIRNIDKIISDLIGEEEKSKMKKDFLEFAKKGVVNRFNSSRMDKGENQEQKENRAKYKKYEGKSKGYKKLQEDFFEKLYEEGINFCCYCGKDRITHFKGQSGKFKKLYDIEHFLPRSKFPDLSINLYNWLPVCMSCNQRLKGNNNPLGKSKIFHPYFGFIDLKLNPIKSNSLDEEYSFIENNKEDKELIYSSEHSNFFQLDKIYLNSQDTFNIFNFIQDKITKIKDEKMKFKETSKSDNKLKDYFFKNYYPKNEQDILKFSNGKLKKDLIDCIKLN